MSQPVEDHMHVVNVPFGEKSPIAKNVLINNAQQRITIDKLLNYIAASLAYIVHITVQRALSTLGNYKYCVVGGKAINELFSSKKCFYTFVHDIHVNDKKTRDILLTLIKNNINTYFDSDEAAVIRNQMYFELSLMNIVRLDNINFYQKDKLFFSGFRHDRNNQYSIAGIFLRLKLRNDLFRGDAANFWYSNRINESYKPDDDIKYSVKENELYISIANIDISSDVNYGIDIFKPYLALTTSIDNIDKIKYLNYAVLLYNLLKSIMKVYYKLSPNMSRLKCITNYDMYSCDQLKMIPVISDKILSIEVMNRHLREDLTYPPPITQLEGLDFLNSKYVEIIKTIIFKIRQATAIRCSQTPAIPIYPSPIAEVYGMTNGEIFFGTKLCTVDAEFGYIVYRYCNWNVKIDNAIVKLSYDINMHNQLISASLVPNYKYKKMICEPSQFKCGGKTYNIGNLEYSLSSETDYIAVCDGIDKVINKFHTGLEDFVSTGYFTVTCPQNIINFSMYEPGRTISILDAKTNDIIYYPNYIMATENFNRYTGKPSDTVLEIMINKRSKTWLYLGQYCTHADVLIKRDQLYIVKNVRFGLYMFGTIRREARIITLELLSENIIDTVKHHISEHDPSTLALQDVIINNPWFIYACEYAYYNYFKKPYTELFIDPSDSHAVTKLGIVYRSNHGLIHSIRVASYIQVFGLIIKKYGGTELFNIVNYKNLFASTMLALFSVSGRESEASFETGVGNPKYSNPHKRYLTISAGNFRIFCQHIRGMGCNIIDTKMEEMLANTLIYSYYIINNDGIPLDVKKEMDERGIDTNNINYKYFALIQSYAHILDLMRCKTADESSGGYKIENILAPSDPVYNEYKVYLYDFVVNMLNATGDRIWGSADKDMRPEYIDDIFYHCSTNPKYAVDVVSRISRIQLFKLFQEVMSFATDRAPRREGIPNMSEFIKKSYISLSAHQHAPTSAPPVFQPVHPHAPPVPQYAPPVLPPYLQHHSNPSNPLVYPPPPAHKGGGSGATTPKPIGENPSTYMEPNPMREETQRYVSTGKTRAKTRDIPTHIEGTPVEEQMETQKETTSIGENITDVCEIDDYVSHIRTMNIYMPKVANKEVYDLMREMPIYNGITTNLMLSDMSGHDMDELAKLASISNVMFNLQPRDMVHGGSRADNKAIYIKNKAAYVGMHRF